MPRAFGAYELLEEIARGGMGIVFRARQTQINRLVAVKVVVSGVLASPDFVERFRTETEAVASLNHPNIVPIYEVGDCEGQPFFSMRFIEGGSLAQRIADPARPLPHRDAANLLAKLARAVHYAHQRGILHRDIKPGNILLDAQGEPHLTDFGLARLVEKDSTLTHTMAMLGTPSYMSPEQARGAAKELTTAVDVYGLGAVFYELLTGQPPFAGGSTIETVRQVLDKEPRRPSALKPGLDRDLETICLKCLEKDPGRRYGSAEAFAADLDRWQQHDPILARPSTPWERISKWIRRNRAWFVALLAIALLLVGGVAVSTWQAVEATRARREENKQRIAAQAAQALAETQQKKAEAEKQRAEAQLTRAEWLSYASKLALAQTDFETGNGGLALRYLNECQPNLRGWEWGHLWNRMNAKLTLAGHGTFVAGVAFSGDGKRLVVCSEGEVKMFDAVTGEPLLKFEGHKQNLSCVAFSPDDRWIVTGAGAGGQGIQPGEAKVWDATTGHLRFDLQGHQYPVFAVAISRDGKLIATAAAENTYNGSEVKIWDAVTGNELLTLPFVENVRCLAFHPGDQGLLTGTQKGKLEVWDVSSGEKMLTVSAHTDKIHGVAFSPDGKRMISSSWDRTAKIWDAKTGQEIFVLKGHDSAVASAVFSPDGAKIVTSSWDQTAKIWNAETAQEMLTLKGHSAWVWTAAFSPDGKRVVTGSFDNTARVWDAERGQEIPTLKGHWNSVNSLAFRSDGKRLASGSDDGTVKIWDLVAGRELLTLGQKTPAWPKGGVWTVAFSPDGRRIVTGGQDQSAKVWDAETGQFLFSLEHTNVVLSAAFSPDGQRIAVVSGWYGEERGGEIKIWDAAGGRLLHTLQPARSAWSVAFSPDGQRVVTGSASRTVKVWDVTTGVEVLALRGHARGVGGVAFSADGQRIVTGSHDLTAKVWNAATGEALLTLKGHSGFVRTVAFSPDGQRIVTGGDDRTVRIWEAVTGQEVLVFRGHGDNEIVRCVAFSPDGERIVSGTLKDAAVKIWSAAPAP